VPFLTILRNNFKEMIIPRLEQQAREAIEAQTLPEDMKPLEVTRLKRSILNTTLGKKKFFFKCNLHFKL